MTLVIAGGARRIVGASTRVPASREGSRRRVATPRRAVTPVAPTRFFGRSVSGASRPRRRAAPVGAFGFGTDDGYPSTLRPPIPLPEAVAVGLECAVGGAKTALASPSDAWKPLTGAVAALALVLDGAGFYAFGAVLSPSEDAGFFSKLFREITTVAADGATLILAPLVALAVVQQVLPLLGEKIFFDGARAAAGEAAVQSDENGRSGTNAFQDRTKEKPAVSSRLRRLDALEKNPGLGLRGLGTAASRTSALAGLTAAAAPAGVLVTALVPGVGAVFATLLVTSVASYALAWELLDPYFDKKALNFQAQDKVMWENKFLLVAFATPFTAALAVPIVGPLATSVAQGACGYLVWRVFEWEPSEEEGREEVERNT